MHSLDLNHEYQYLLSWLTVIHQSFDIHVWLQWLISSLMLLDTNDLHANEYIDLKHHQLLTMLNQTVHDILNDDDDEFNLKIQLLHQCN